MGWIDDCLGYEPEEDWGYSEEDARIEIDRVLQVSSSGKAVLIGRGYEAEWVPMSQISWYNSENIMQATAIEIPLWLAEEKGWA